MKKLLFTILAAIALSPLTASAIPVTVPSATAAGDILYGLSSGKYTILPIGANGTCLGVSSNLPAFITCGTGGGGVGTSTNPFMATYFVATSTTATSTFAGGIQSNLLNVISTTASSTFANGINLTSGCFSVRGVCITSTVTAGAGGGSAGGTWSTTTSSVAGRLNNYSNNTTDIVNIGGTATTTSNYYFDPNLNTAVLGRNSNFISGRVYTNGFFQTPTQVQITGHVDDLQSNLTIGNTSNGPFSTGGITWINASSTNGATFDTSNNYAYAGLAAPNFATFPGLPGNGFVLSNNNGPLIFGAISATSSLSFMGWAINQGYTSANYDMVLKNVDTLQATDQPNGGLGIGTTTPYARLAISASSTASYPYIIVASTTNGLSANNSTVFTIAANEKAGLSTSTPGTTLSIGQTNGINIEYSSTSTFPTGINLKGGCFSINSVCITGGGGVSGPVTTTLEASCEPQTDSTDFAPGGAYWQPIYGWTFTNATSSRIMCNVAIPKNLAATPNISIMPYLSATSSAGTGIGIVDVAATSTGMRQNWYTTNYTEVHSASTTASKRWALTMGTSLPLTSTTTITLAGFVTPAGGDILKFEITRYGADANDTVENDLFIPKVLVQLDTN